MKKFLFVLLSVLLCFSMVGCEDKGAPSAVTVSSVSIINVPTKTVYNVNEVISADGGKLSIDYSDGAHEEVGMTSEMLSHSGTASHGVKSVKVKYSASDIETSFDILVVDLTVSSLDGMTKTVNNDYVYINGDFFSNKKYEFNKNLSLFSDGTVLVNPQFIIHNYTVNLNSFKIDNSYNENLGFTHNFNIMGTAKLNMSDVDITNTNTNGFGPLYGFIVCNDAAVGSKLTMTDCNLIDTHQSVGDNPSIIGGGGTLEVDFSGCKFVTSTAEIHDEDRQSWAIFSVELSGKIENCLFEGCAINTFNARSLEIIGNTFTKAMDTQIALAGEFSLINNTFKEAAKNQVRYVGIFGFVNSVKVEGNKFDLGGDNLKYSGIRFGYEGLALNSDLLSVSGNEFTGNGVFAIDYYSQFIGKVIDFDSNNTLNDNKIIDNSKV